MGPTKVVLVMFSLVAACSEGLTAPGEVRPNPVPEWSEVPVDLTLDVRGMAPESAWARAAGWVVSIPSASSFDDSVARIEAASTDVQHFRDNQFRSTVATSYWGNFVAHLGALDARHIVDAERFVSASLTEDAVRDNIGTGGMQSVVDLGVTPIECFRAEATMHHYAIVWRSDGSEHSRAQRQTGDQVASTGTVEQCTPPPPDECGGNDTVAPLGDSISRPMLADCDGDGEDDGGGGGGSSGGGYYITVTICEYEVTWRRDNGGPWYIESIELIGCSSYSYFVNET